MATTTTRMSIPNAICAAINAAERALSYDLQITRGGFEILEVDIVTPPTFNEGTSRDCFLTLQIASGETYYGVDIWVLLKKQSKWSPIMGGRWIPERLCFFASDDFTDAYKFYNFYNGGIFPDKSDEAYTAWVEARKRLSHQAN